MKDLSKAMAEVDTTYEQLSPIVTDMVKKCTANIDSVVASVSVAEVLTDDMLRDAMLKLSLASYSFSEIKEKAALKASCAESIRKAKYAEEYSKAEGAVAQRDNTAVLNSAESMLVDYIYDCVASTLKTKLDEAHRVVDTLKSIQMGRMAEAKLSQTTSVGQPGEKTFLFE